MSRDGAIEGGANGGGEGATEGGANGGGEGAPDDDGGGDVDGMGQTKLPYLVEHLFSSNPHCLNKPPDAGT
jgi:hypothetical protein